MKVFVLIIWLTGPTAQGEIVEVGPVLVGSYTTKASCLAQLARMIKTSYGKVRGTEKPCEEWT